MPRKTPAPIEQPDTAPEPAEAAAEPVLEIAEMPEPAPAPATNCPFCAGTGWVVTDELYKSGPNKDTPKVANCAECAGTGQQ